MSSGKVRIRYDGPALAEHSIDVDDLAPALLAVGELCKLANKKFNGDRASVKVLVNANLDQNCFELYIELVQTLLDQTKALIGNEDVATVKDILEWLGIIASPGIAIGVYKLCKVLGKNNKNIVSKKLQVQGGKDVTKIKIKGDNNIVNIHPQTDKLVEDPAVIKNVKETLKPLAKKGYETLGFETDDGQREEITKDEAGAILDTDFTARLDLTDKEKPQVITALIRVYAPVCEEDTKNWRFELDGRPVTIDISDTDIAEKTIKRGGALVNDTYRVKLEMTQTKTLSGDFRFRYKILEVLEFHPAKLTSQRDLFSKSKSSKNLEAE